MQNATSMSNFSEYNPNDIFALERKYVPLFRKHCIIAINNELIDPKGFNLREVPNRLYKIFDPVFTEEKRQLDVLVNPDTDVIYEHMVCVRADAHDVIGEEYLLSAATGSGILLRVKRLSWSLRRK